MGFSAFMTNGSMVRNNRKYYNLEVREQSVLGLLKLGNKSKPFIQQKLSSFVCKNNENE